MKQFTGFEYLLIDVANQFGLDKLTFEDRIDWAMSQLHDLESLAELAETKPLYLKAAMAVRDAQAGRPSGHLVAFDAVCSGIQIMSVATGCIDGARATGLVDPDVRSDAYTDVTEAMNIRLANIGFVGVSFPRDDVKYAVMTSGYASEQVPKDLFGDETPELACFNEACFEVAPGAFTLLGELLDTWKPYAKSHNWILPDNFHVQCKVMEKIEKAIVVDELDRHSFTYTYKENVGQGKGLSNVANVVHSIDAFVLRELLRRCSYDRDTVETVLDFATVELMERADGVSAQVTQDVDHMIEALIEAYDASGMISLVILEHLSQDFRGVAQLSSGHLRALNKVLLQVLDNPPFPVVTIHDSFASHPNNMNVVRYWYTELMAELADGTILNDLFTQLMGTRAKYQKLSTNLGATIRQSNYALS